MVELLQRLQARASWFNFLPLALIYWILAQTSLHIDLSWYVAALTWLPAGFGAVIVYRWPVRGVLAVLLGALLSTLAGFDAATAPGIMFTVTLEAILMATGLRFIAPSQALYSLRGSVWVIVLAGLACLPAAMLGPWVMIQHHHGHGQSWSTLALAWWVGDVSGMLIMLPLCLHPWRDSPNQNRLETLPSLILLAATLLSSAISFMNLLPVASEIRFINLPILVAAALWLPMPAAMALVVLMLLMLAIGNEFDLGYLSNSHDPGTLIAQGLFIMIAAALIILLGGLTREREDLEKNLRESAQRLRDSHRQLASTSAEREQALARLLETEKLTTLGSMVASMAHELNTPLGNSLTLASGIQHTSAQLEQMVQGKAVQRSDILLQLSDLQEAARLLVRSSERARDLIANFKNMAVDQSSSRRRHFYLPEICRDIVHLLQPQIRRSPYQLLLQCDLDIWMDSFPGALEQVVMNLINNAFLHAFDGRHDGWVRLSVHALASAEEIELRVTDNGRGINATAMQHLFEAFFTTRNDSGGSGLGLYVARQLVRDVLGGELSVSSEAGQGSVFSLRLPQRAPDPHSP